MEEKDAKERIVNGARELFMKYGIRSVSMDDIARHLGASKKTIYQYFADKDEIVTQVAQMHMANDRQEFDQIKEVAKDALDELIRTSIFFRKHIQQMNPSLMFDLQKYHGKAWMLWQEYKKQHVFEAVVKNMKRGIEEGLFRPTLNAEVLASMRIEVVELAFDTDVFPASQFNLTEVQMHLFDHFIYGLLTEKGRKQYEKYKQEPNNHELTPNHA